MATKSKQEYKTTEIGEIPQEWEVVRISESIQITGGFAFKSSDYVESGILNFRVSNIDDNEKNVGNNKKFLPYNYSKKYADFLLDIGDILIVMVGASIGKMCMIRKEILPALLNQNMWKLKPKYSGIDNYFLYNYLANKTVPNYLGKASGSARNFLQRKDFKKLFIPLPPLLYQQKISSILSSIDEDIEKSSKIITNAKMLQNGLMQQLLTRGIGHTKFKQTEIGEIPEKWSIAECSELFNDITVGIVTTPAKYYQDSGIPCLRSFNILKNQIYNHNLVYISPESNLLHRKSILHKGDVVTVRTGRPGISCVVPSSFDGANCVDLIILRSSGQIDAQFMSRYLNSNVASKQIFSIKTGSMQQHLNISMIRKLITPVPPIIEQQSIVKILSTVDSRLSNEKSKFLHLKQLKKGLMQVLLTGKVRVRVN